MSDGYDTGKQNTGAFTAAAAAAAVMLQSRSSVSLLIVLPPRFSICGCSFPSPFAR